MKKKAEGASNKGVLCPKRKMLGCGYPEQASKRITEKSKNSTQKKTKNASDAKNAAEKQKQKMRRALKVPFPKI